MATEANKHIWKFYRYGGIDQVELETSDDLTHLDELDPKLWAAMTCPVSDMDFDEKTLAYLDTDGDKRIKIPEVVAGTKWISSVLKNPSSIIKPEAALPLDAINDANPEGKDLLETATQVLFNLGKKDVKSISLEDMASTEKIFAATSYNGDGIIAVSDDFSADCNKVIGEIIDCMGSDQDRSGKPGVSQARLDAFFADLASYSAWVKLGKTDASILVNGDATAANDGIMNAVRAKIDDYFTRCRLAAFDAKYAEVGQKLDDEYIALLKKSLTANTEELKELPLAKVATEPVLELKKQINPAWAEAIAAFTEKVVKPTIGSDEKLTEADWSKIKALYAPFENWQNSKGGASVEKLGEARADELLAGKMKDEITALIASDQALEPRFTRLTNVEKMIRYYKYLFILLNNFVAFKAFYDKKKTAIFQAGTLYIDGRSCSLSIKVADVGAHSARAVAANTFLVYCECTRKNTGEKMNIAVAVTDGESENLIVGRNGIFVDTKGNYWDAVISKVVDHPISVRQAFWTPYKKLGKMINEQIEKYASSKDKAVTDKLTASVDTAGNKLTAAPADPAAAPAAPASSFNAAQFAGIFAAVGLALATIGSAISTVVSGFMGLAWWQMPLAIIGILLLISGPSMIMTAMKLHNRNLGAILDANGWAINTKARINITMGRFLTSLAKLPKNSKRCLDDPFEEENNTWKYWVIGILIVLCLIGWYAPDTYCWKAELKSFVGMELSAEGKAAAEARNPAPVAPADAAATPADAAPAPTDAAPAPADATPAPADATPAPTDAAAQ